MAGHPGADQAAIGPDRGAIRADLGEIWGIPGHSGADGAYGQIDAIHSGWSMKGFRLCW